jgi:hypothetical protein
LKDEKNEEYFEEEEEEEEEDLHSRIRLGERRECGRKDIVIY